MLLVYSKASSLYTNHFGKLTRMSHCSKFFDQEMAEVPEVKEAGHQALADYPVLVSIRSIQGICELEFSTHFG